MDLDHALTTTRTVRRRLDLERPVPRDVVLECLTLALQAPNGSNTQPWRWVVIDDPATRAAAAEIYRGAIVDVSARSGGQRSFDSTTASGQRLATSVEHLRDNLERVPVLVVPLVRGRFEREPVYFQAARWGSILPAVWSFMLALRARGLGSAWTTIHLAREQEMAELIGVPYDEWTQAGLFPVAYTVGTDFRPAERGRAEDVVAWNRWSFT
ncbi:MAG TPA: nitroreductase family protein [Acidimicrobiales bacterium]|nr:nitroreductase family protein [Acidimicrobiales bacterium]